jgi:5-(carboxyamino)imidazole ribonucleotide synthase
MIYNTRQEAYYVYIILCGDGTYYTGLTDDLLRRFEEHLQCVYEDCYTAIRQPLELKYYETIPFLQDAVDRERQLKGWSKAKKQALIEGNFHKLQLLAECQNLSHNKYRELNKILENTGSVFDTSTPLSTIQTGQQNPSTSLRGDKNSMKKIGILGGGQLGRMLLQAAANYPVETFVLENDAECPSAHLCNHFIKGNISSYDDVYNFGKGLDAITIEIENVNADALEQLEKEGVKIYPKPAALKTIKNKILQKEFYKQHQLPTSDFVVTENMAALNEHLHFLPAVHKLGEGGYDGKGVQIIRTSKDISLGFDAPAVLEKMVPIAKEIAMIVAVNDAGDMVFYPPVDMVFDHDLNLLSHQVSPAELADKTFWKVEAISIAVVKAFKSPGIFAVELFVDKAGEVYVNETAPRVHNSGHHTIEANYSSQFDMLWRIMLNYPLGSTEHILPAAIVNILGAEGHNGPAYYEGLEEVLKIPNSFVHVYGKNQTKPGRKMGHVTILSKEKQELIHQVNRIKNTLKVITI